MYEMITPWSPEYNSARQLWNRVNDLYPESIAICNNEKEVKDAVLSARRQNKKIRIRTGGHNYVGVSSGNGSFVIDISNMNQIEINNSCNTVTIQAGALLGQIYNLLGAKGYPFPGGTCATVGISGVVSGGGWGYSSRYFGLACDSLLSLRMITADGYLITADSKRNSDLFWAVRGGGGGNFGVITSFVFRLPEKVNSVICFRITFDNPSIENQVQFLDTWQSWISYAPNAVNMKGSILNSASEGIQIHGTGLFYGSLEQLTEILYPFSQIPGYQITFDQVSFLQAFQIITSEYPPYTFFIPYGRFVSSMYSRETLVQLVNQINSQRPLGSSLVELNVYGLGGAVKEKASQETAFYYRESNYIILFETFFENNSVFEPNYQWVEQNAAQIYGLTDGSYINFPYLNLPEYMRDYYGGNAECLQKVKYKYDPENVFCFPQSIR